MKQVLKKISQKRVLIPLITLILILVLLEAIVMIFGKETTSPNQIVYGVTYSADYASSLGLDWKQAYAAILDDLKVRDLRLPTFWEDLEPSPGHYNFTQLDYLVSEASKRQVKLTLVVGTKQPRWPECHLPDWAKNLNPKDRQIKAIAYIATVIQRYKNNPAVAAWQVENEPFFHFGDNCDTISFDDISSEIKLVKSLDPQLRPIIVTDTGEWRTWVSAAQVSDTLGISVYTMAYAPTVGRIRYPFTPSYYIVKSNLVRKIFAPKNQKTIITELQAEPWTQNFIADTPIDQQIQLFTLLDLKSNVKLAQDIGFDQIYFWGVEWWYWMKVHQHPEYWNYLKTLFLLDRL